MAATVPNPALRDGDDRMSAVLAKNWWALALRGLFAILFGIVALFAPGAVLVTLALFFAAYLLVDGILAIIAAIRAAQRHERWGLLLAEGGDQHPHGPDRGPVSKRGGARVHHRNRGLGAAHRWAKTEAHL